MYTLSTSYIDGTFVPVRGTESLLIISPTTENVLGTVTLANREDAVLAIEAAARAQRLFARSPKAQRIDMLRALQAAVLRNADSIRDSAIEEYGGVYSRTQWVSQYVSQSFANAIQTLEDYPLVRTIGAARVSMEPVGVAALIVPWNSVAGTVCSKLASAIAAGCTSVIKPSELSPLQTQVITEALHSAGLPDGLFNVLLGRGHDVGDELSTNPTVAKISFTGSTPTGKLIARAGLDSLKRVSLSLTGKCASILLEDADLASAIPMIVNAAFMNNGQACVAGSRLLVPSQRADEVVAAVKACVDGLVVGDPWRPDTSLGPLASAAQFDRVQHFIRQGLEQGARLVAGGAGRPDGIDRGYFVKPTVFADVTSSMAIAQEEIFGPVLSIMTYDSEEQAVEIANDTIYGLQAYIFGKNLDRAKRMASQLEAGTVLINRATPELLAPFGGLKQSGIGREFGVHGLEAFLEAKSVVVG
ncbi:aldehyde dehydrogenase family protein [Pseudomonas sp. R2-60-08W]|uniref:aldehyde dehydrogenase family protein n=1 Tax=Pseudomonas sp. R2-60-08W TaxID=1173280 RepID=UPI000F574BAF|nr:aldehyde dehydrogenase family protein [Pseudomonas sp. R2-60-08W]AZF26895.1 Aldehyde dehydrogenase [Pseudomonas sp. R2-60-08W]